MYSHHKFDHEFNYSGPTLLSIMICAAPRSGSSLICEGLCNTGMAGAPSEYFDPEQVKNYSRLWKIGAFDKYLQKLLSKKTSPNGVFGFKVHFPQYETYFKNRDVYQDFPNLKFIYVTRNDLVKQAVSYSKAVKTGQWASHNEGNAGKPVFDVIHIRQLMNQIKEYEESWERFFRCRNIDPIRVVYEDFVKDFENNTIKIIKRLGINTPDKINISPPTLKKQADRVSNQWVKRYLLHERYGANFEKAPAHLKVIGQLEKVGQKLASLFKKRRPVSAVGFIDLIRKEEKGLVVDGHLLLEDSCPDSIKFVSASNQFLVADRKERLDLNEAYPQIPNASQAGFIGALPADIFMNQGKFEFTICALKKNKMVFSCHVLYESDESGFLKTGAPYFLGDRELRI